MSTPSHLLLPGSPHAAFAGHAALSHLFYWRQSGTYDIALDAQLARFNVTPADLPAYRELVVPRVQALVRR
jgi:hypothetical protein